MSFINDLAFGEKLDELEIEGDLKVGGDILLQGAFPKMDQKILDLNTTIGYKANQSDLDEMEVTLNTKANQVRRRLFESESRSSRCGPRVQPHRRAN